MFPVFLAKTINILFLLEDPNRKLKALVALAFWPVYLIILRRLLLINERERTEERIKKQIKKIKEAKNEKEFANSIVDPFGEIDAFEKHAKIVLILTAILVTAGLIYWFACC